MIWSDRLWGVSLMSALTDLKWRLRWLRHSDARRFSLFGIMSRRTMYKNLLAACAAVFSIHSAQAQPAAAAKPPLKVAVVHVTPVTEAGWVRQHENARLALEKALELREGLCNSRWRWKSIAELSGMHPELRSTYNFIGIPI